LTEHVSFIPNSILRCCKIIPIQRPEKEVYEKLINTNTPAWCPRSKPPGSRLLSPEPDSILNLK
jgi:hypothetical protein